MSELSPGGAREGCEGRVLMVDDEAEVRAVFSEFLRERGLDVIEAANGLEALLLSGLDALKRIRAFDPSITVVILTGVVDDALRRRALALGASRVFTKPVALADLWRALAGGATTPSAPTEHQEPSPWHPPNSGPAAMPTAPVLLIDDDSALREALREF